jgi:hypothetical protein
MMTPEFHILDDHYCRALASVTDKDQLRVTLYYVAFMATSKEAFVETLQLSQGPNLDLVGVMMVYRKCFSVSGFKVVCG